MYAGDGIVTEVKGPEVREGRDRGECGQGRKSVIFKDYICESDGVYWGRKVDQVIQGRGEGRKGGDVGAERDNLMEY